MLNPVLGPVRSRLLDLVPDLVLHLMIRRSGNRRSPAGGQTCTTPAQQREPCTATVDGCRAGHTAAGSGPLSGPSAGAGHAIGGLGPAWLPSRQVHATRSGISLPHLAVRGPRRRPAPHRFRAHHGLPGPGPLNYGNHTVVATGPLRSLPPRSRVGRRLRKSGHRWALPPSAPVRRTPGSAPSAGPAGQPAC